MVNRVLLDQDNEPVNELCASLIILYRYRNNLFHGLKWAYDFHESCGTLPDGPLANYVDFAAIGRDAELGGDIFTIDAGGGAVHVFWSR